MGREGFVEGWIGVERHRVRVPGRSCLQIVNCVILMITPRYFMLEQRTKIRLLNMNRIFRKT
jgi:hypothetical protein